MSATLIPEADPERLFELEKTGETDELMALANQALEEAEINREYDIGYRTKDQKTSEHSGSYYSSHEVSPYYDGSEPEIHVSIESGIDEFYANLNGEFRLVENNGEDRTYKLVMSCDEGILLKGEVGFGEREITDFRYTRGDEENNNRLQVYLDGSWCRFGNAAELGEGNETMKHIEFVDSVYKQLNDVSSVEDQKWETVYSSGMEEDFDNLPSYIESTVDSKTTEFEQNLDLGLQPEKMFSAMSPPWKPLLEMRLGSDHRAIFIAASNLSSTDLPEDLEGNRKIIGLSVESKKEFKQKFRSDGNNQVKSASSYAFESIDK